MRKKKHFFKKCWYWSGGTVNSQNMCWLSGYLAFSGWYKGHPWRRQEDKKHQWWGKARACVSCFADWNWYPQYLDVQSKRVCQKTSLTEGGASFRPRHWRDDDKTEAFVLAAADLYIIGLQGGRDRGGGVGGLRGGGGSCSGDHSVATAPCPSAPTSAADAGGGSAAGADGIEGVLAALRGALPYLFRQAGRLGAAVVGGRRRWRHISLRFNWRWQKRIRWEICRYTVKGGEREKDLWREWRKTNWGQGGEGRKIQEIQEDQNGEWRQT